MATKTVSDSNTDIIENSCLHLLGLSEKETRLLENQLKAPLLNCIDTQISMPKGEEENIVDKEQTIYVHLHCYLNKSKDQVDLEVLINQVKKIIFSFVDNNKIKEFVIWKWI